MDIYEDYNGTEYVLAEDADEIRNQMHMNAAKILSREAIIKNLSEDYNAILRVARAAKALKDIFDLPWQKDSTIWTKEEHALFEAVEAVEDLL